MPVYGPEGEELHKPRMQRLGIVRLGLKAEGTRKDGSTYTYPKATDYFVLKDAPALLAKFGPESKVLEPIILPSEDDATISDYLRLYGATWGLVCIGDGRTANRLVDRDLLQKNGDITPASHNTKPGHVVRQKVSCPCNLLAEKECGETLYLRFIMPTIPGFGVWQLGTGSGNSIKNLMGSIQLIKALTGGQITGIPLSLKLVPMNTVSLEAGKKTVHVLQLSLMGELTMMDVIEGKATLFRPALAPPQEQEPPLDQSQPAEKLGDASDPEAVERGTWRHGDREEAPDDLPATDSQEAPPEPRVVEGTVVQPPTEQPASAMSQLVTASQYDDFKTLMLKRNVPFNDVANYLAKHFKKSRVGELTQAEYTQVVTQIKKEWKEVQPAKKQPAAKDSASAAPKIDPHADLMANPPPPIQEAAAATGPATEPPAAQIAPPSQTAATTPATNLTANDVFMLAKELVIEPSQVHAILSTPEHRVTLPQWINEGHTYQEALDKLRAYHDRAGEPNA